MAFLKTNQAEIFYEVIGDSGPLLTLVNGHTRSSADFRMMTRYLTEHGIRSLIFDNRGSGRTKYSGPFSLDDMTQDILDLWNDLQVTNSAVLGISMGGLISQKLSYENPSRVSKLVLVSTAADPQYIMPGRGEWSEDESQIRDKLGRFFSTSYLAKNTAIFDAMVKQTQKAILENNFSERAVDQKNAFMGTSFADKVDRIQCPTLIIHGADDRAVDPEGARQLQRSIKNSRLALLEGRGHLLLAECPKDLYSLVVQFLK